MKEFKVECEPPIETMREHLTVWWPVMATATRTEDAYELFVSLYPDDDPMTMRMGALGTLDGVTIPTGGLWIPVPNSHWEVCAKDDDPLGCFRLRRTKPAMTKDEFLALIDEYGRQCRIAGPHCTTIDGASARRKISQVVNIHWPASE